MIADIPGLIEGAHEGHGLGDRFLGHVERCRVLLHLVDAGTEHAGKAYKTVRRELEAYGGDLADKPEIVALSKIDTVDQATLQAQALRLKRAAKQTPLRLSAATGAHLTDVSAPAFDEDRRGKESQNGSDPPPSRSGTLERGEPSGGGSLSRTSLPCHQKFQAHRHQGRLVPARRSRARLRQAEMARIAGARHRGFARQGADLLVVSSGAIALGRTVLGLPERDLKLEDSQAAAAIGQIALARIWAEVLADRKLTAGQILVTLGDTEERQRYLNARATIGRLLDLRAVPVINENDTVATNEIRYGDNDRLAARVATMASADLLILLSDVQGLYTAPPSENPEAELVPIVARVDAAIEAMAGGAASRLSRGGMRTKIEAAKIATAGGTHMIITDGRVEHPVSRLNDGGALHLVPDRLEPGHRPEKMDRGRARTAWRLACRCGRGARDRQWQKPAARRRDARRGEFHERRLCLDPRLSRRRDRPRSRRL